MNFIDIKHANKTFGGVHALSDVSFAVEQGEVRGLIGENGSGKSTLMKILAGVLQPDSGEITVEGKLITNYGPLAGLQLGISVIYQDLSLFPNLTVLENVCLCDEIRGKQKIVNVKKYSNEVKDLLDKLGAGINLSDILGELPIAKQQLVAIARALLNKSKLLIFDEPTTALTREEINQLFELINKLKKENISIIFISHKIDEILEICDTISVLRDGHMISTEKIENQTETDIEKLIVGKDVHYESNEHKSVDWNVVTLEVEHLSKKNNFKDISFSLHKGEVLGISGLLGSGRTELVSAIFGVIPYESGEIKMDGKPIVIKSVEDAVKNGICLVPEDRRVQGLIMNYTQRDNVVVPSLSKLVTKQNFVDEEKITNVASNQVKNVGVKTDNIYNTMMALSGGNQQKVVIGKWLEMNPRILILDGPTVGVDIGAKASIFSKIHEMIQINGMSVILISDEIKELTANCDRILLMKNGKLDQELTKPEEMTDAHIRKLLNTQKKLA